ncbi:MAG: glycosyltransferase [Actinomycetota bacterium]
MRQTRILAVASAAVLDLPYGCTPAWWQLWKALYENGADVIVTPYRGQPVEAPWWRTYPNPCAREGAAFAGMRKLMNQLNVNPGADPQNAGVTTSDKVVQELVRRWVRPRWERHLDEIFERERRIDAVIFFTPPSSHMAGIPTRLRDRYDVPVIYYDGDIPMSLPEFGGMDTGFDPENGGDPAEYDLVLSNSEGGLPRLRELGARRAEALFWAADPELFRPLDVPKEYDVFFYGIGDKFRQGLVEEFVGEPSRRMPDVDFVLGGRETGTKVGNARPLGPVPLNVFARTISASRLSLNITRGPHASVFASSTCRPFELAAAGAAIVSGPHAGIERWFEPGSELILVSNADEAVAAYRALLDDPGAAEAMGHRARERVLDEHTYGHRARQLLELVGTSQATGHGGAPVRHGRRHGARRARAGTLALKPQAYYVASRAYQRARLVRATSHERRHIAPGLRILGYHRVAPVNDVLNTPPENFRAQLEHMLELGFKPVRLSDSLELLAERLEDSLFAVTFDDGYQDILEHAVPILSELQVPASIFLPTRIIDGDLSFHWYRDPPPALDWDEVELLARDGLIDFQSHSRSHYSLPQLSDDEAHDEIFRSKHEIEQRVGYELTSFCYPAGRYGDRELRLIREAGYRVGVTTNPGINSGGRMPRTLCRTMVYWRDSLRDFDAKVKGALDESTHLQRWIHRRRSQV